jgi:RNA polymerase sigma factor (sigma-70 family)
VATTAVPTRRRAQVPLGKRLLAGLSDDALVQRVRDGDERAFEVVYDRFHRGLLAFTRHMLGSLHEAEDALQQTFVAAHAGLLRDERDVALKPWLYTIARNRCMSMLRARREQASELVEPATAGLAEQVESRAELRAMLADIAHLPEQQRAAIVLAEVGDLSHAEIGEVVGVETVKVKALIFQARSALIEARRARETPCAEIREQLANARGGELRRGELRRHLKVCAGCAEFRDEVRRQRALLAVALPVLPSLALKRSVLAAAGIGSGGGGAGLAAGVAVKGGAAKLLTLGAIGTAAVGGGVALEESGTLSPSQTHQAPPAAQPAHSGVGSRVSGVGGKTINARSTPQPRTSHATPHTRHPAPHTRHPAPRTRHPAPHTRHPKTAPHNSAGKLHSQLKGTNGKAHAYGHTKAPPAKLPHPAKPPKPVKPKSQAPIDLPQIPAPGTPPPAKPDSAPGLNGVTPGHAP